MHGNFDIILFLLCCSFAIAITLRHWKYVGADISAEFADMMFAWHKDGKHLVIKIVSVEGILSKITKICCQKYDLKSCAYRNSINMSECEGKGHYFEHFLHPSS